MHDSVRARSTASEAARHLARLLEEESDFERLLDGYIEAKRTLARSFRDLSDSRVDPANQVIADARQEMTEQMRAMYGDVLPQAYLCAPSLGSTHAKLLGYLMAHVGTPVPASRLRVLTGDQTHTERRVRELRQIGLSVDAVRSRGENRYVLRDLILSLDEAIPSVLASNLKADKGLSNAERSRLLRTLGRVD